MTFILNSHLLQKSHKELLTALKSAQFGFGHGRCSVCAGWNMGPNGETDQVHTKKCPVGLAIQHAEEFYDSPEASAYDPADNGNQGS